MDSFEYLITLVSVIAGLGITRSLSGIARLFDTRRNISFSWIPICWTFNVLLWLIAFWWFTFLLSSFEGWSPWLHVFVLFYAGVIFFLLALLHPESLEEGHDMLGYFLDNRKMFFGTLLVLALIDVADTSIKIRIGLPTPPLMQYAALILPWIIMSTLALFIRNRKFHALFALVFLALIAFWLSSNIAGILAIVAGDA